MKHPKLIRRLIVALSISAVIGGISGTAYCAKGAVEASNEHSELKREKNQLLLQMADNHDFQQEYYNALNALNVKFLNEEISPSEYSREKNRITSTEYIENYFQNSNDPLKSDLDEINKKIKDKDDLCHTYIFSSAIPLSALYAPVIAYDLYKSTKEDLSEEDFETNLSY